LADIFISYAHDDRAQIEPLAKALEAEGYSVWWDLHMVGGSEYSRTIETQLNEAKAVIIAWSGRATESTWVKDEAQSARDQGKIIPISIDGAVPPMGFRQYHVIDFGGGPAGGLSEKSWDDLLRAVRYLIPREGVMPETHEPAQIAQAPMMKPLPMALAGAAALIALIALIAGNPFSGDDDGSRDENVAAVQPAAETPVAEPAPVAAAKTVAVLPFLAFSTNEDDRFFADGLTEEILNALTALPDVIVTSRTSSFQFRGEDIPSVPEIAKQLGVSYVVEGSVRRAGDQARVTVQLIRASDDTHLWSETYNRSLDDVFAIQEDIAENVAEFLDVVLDDHLRDRLRASGTRNVNAFIAYQRGYDFFEKHHFDAPDRLVEAEPYFEKAVALAPDLAQAYLLQSDYYTHQLANMLGVSNNFDRAAVEPYQQKLARLLAAAVDAASSPGQRSVARANQIIFADDWTGAGAVVNDVIDLTDCSEDNWAETLAIVSDRIKDIPTRFELLRRCNPLDNTVRVIMVETLIMNRRFQEAEERLVEVPSEYYPKPYLQAMLDTGLRRKSSEETINGLGDAVTKDFIRARQAAMLGDLETARPIVEKMMADDKATLRQKLSVAAVIGDRDLANSLAKAIDDRPLPGFNLTFAILNCLCGAPFDLEATPNYAARLSEAEFSWPPDIGLDFPLKDW